MAGAHTGLLNSDRGRAGLDTSSELMQRRGTGGARGVCRLEVLEAMDDICALARAGEVKAGQEGKKEGVC